MWSVSSQFPIKFKLTAFMWFSEKRWTLSSAHRKKRRRKTTFIAFIVSAQRPDKGKRQFCFDHTIFSTIFLIEKQIVLINPSFLLIITWNSNSARCIINNVISDNSKNSDSDMDEIKQPKVRNSLANSFALCCWQTFSLNKLCFTNCFWLISPKYWKSTPNPFNYLVSADRY